MWPVVSEIPEIQAHYETMRAAGESHNIAEICALGASPYTKSFERLYFEGHANGSEFAGQPKVGDAYRMVAAANGQSTAGKRYCSSLARFPGDPLAWIGDESDARRAIEAGNFQTDGLLKVKRPKSDLAPAPDGPLVAPDIVDEYTEKELAKHPELENARPNEKADIREKVEKRLIGKQVKNKKGLTPKRAKP